VESELDEELRLHMEQQVEKYVRAGLTREEAERQVRLQFGGLDQVKEECRDSRGVNVVETLLLRHAVCVATAKKGAGIHGYDDRDSGIGYRCEHGHLHTSA
jgi:hypothetical protein